MSDPRNENLLLVMSLIFVNIVPLEFANIRSNSIKSLSEVKPRKFVGKAVTHVIAEGLNVDYLDGTLPEPNGVFTTHDSTAPFYSVVRKLKLDGTQSDLVTKIILLLRHRI